MGLRPLWVLGTCLCGLLSCSSNRAIFEPALQRGLYGLHPAAHGGPGPVLRGAKEPDPAGGLKSLWDPAPKLPPAGPSSGVPAFDEDPAPKLLIIVRRTRLRREKAKWRRRSLRSAFKYTAPRRCAFGAVQRKMALRCHLKGQRKGFLHHLP